METTLEAKSFDPDASAVIMKLRVGNHARLTQDIVSELYRARDYYSASGSRSDLVPNGTRLTTFEAYLSEIGLPRRTVYNWLERYVPAENKLLTYEEFSEKKAAEARAKLSAEERRRSIIAEFRRTGVRPAGWTPEIEETVRRSDEAEAKRKDQARKDEAEREQRAKEYRERQEPTHTYRLDSGTLNKAAEAIVRKMDEREDWKEKIRLSDGGKEDAFMDAIIDYLETLPSDTRRIEACNNIIKICRNISVELQRKTAQ